MHRDRGASEAHEKSIIDRIASQKVMPLIHLNQSDMVVPLVNALLQSEVDVLELVLRSEESLQCIEQVKQSLIKEKSKIAIGVGTVLNEKQLDAAFGVGADFVITPGFDASLIGAAQKRERLIIPGVSTVSEVMQAVNLGLSHLKLFPAAVVGGMQLLKALAGPFPDVQFCPTGGVNGSNVAEYLELNNVFAVAGSWVVEASLLEAGDWAKITASLLEMKSV